MNILFTICARAGSKGVKSKNSREFLGIPIAYYTIAAYQEFLERYAFQYDNICLALNTDSQEIINQFSRANLQYVYIPRIEDLAGDVAAKSDVICDTLIKVEQKNREMYDLIVDLDLTSPLRTANDIKGAIDKIISDVNLSVVYSVTNSRRQPHFNLVLEDEKGYLKTAIPSRYTTRQEAPRSYDMNASIYVYRREPLLNTKNKDVFDGLCAGWIMKDTAVLDIDSEEDYDLMQIIAQHFYEIDSEMARIKNRAEKL